MKAIKKALTTAGIALLSVMMLLALVGCDSEEMKSAKEGFNGEVTRIRRVTTTFKQRYRLPKNSPQPMKSLSTIP